MSDSLGPHGLWPTRLLCPWDFPGKNTGVGYHSLLQGNLPNPGMEPEFLLPLLHWQADSLPLSHLENPKLSVQFSSVVQSLFATPWTAVHQASLSITNSQSLLKLMFIELVMPSNHLILCHPRLLPPSIFPSIRVFSKESVVCIRWPKYWSFSFNNSPSNEHPEPISFRMAGWVSLRPRDSQESSPTPQFKSINSSALSFLYSPTLISIHDYWKHHSSDYMDLWFPTNF